MNKIIVSFFATVLTILTVTTANSYHDTVRTPDVFSYEDFLMESYEYVLETHIDGENVNRKDVVEQAVKGMLKAFDPYSAFYTKAEFKEMMNDTEGKYYGIGVQVSFEDNMVKSDVVFEGSPAEKAGLHHGDFIFEIDGEMTETLGFVKSIDKLKGDKNTKVFVRVLRSNGEVDDVIIIRDEIKTKTTRVRVIDNDILYIRLLQFTATAAVEIKQAISEHNVKGLILDLRDNPGGLLNQAVEISDFFVNEGVLIEVRGKKETTITNARNNALLPNIPVAVLMNERSASASEIVGGTLQDLHRATIIGVKSFGKGSVQNIIPLPHGAAIKLTVAKYFTSSGKLIHGVGITPDIEVAVPDDYRYDFENNDIVISKGIEIIRNK